MTAQSEVFTVCTQEQAALLLDLKYADVMSRLMAAEASAAELARSVGAPLGRVHYQLGRLVEVGVVRVCGETVRGGRPVKRYQATARAFHVPYALTSNATLSELLSSLYLPFVRRSVEHLAQDAARRGVSLVTMTINDRGELHYHLTPVSLERGNALGRWGEIRLSRDRAEEFRTRLEALVEEFTTSDPNEGHPYLFGTVLVQADHEHRD